MIRFVTSCFFRPTVLQLIRVEQATVGMFVHELCGPWMKHPFWRPRFPINSELDLERLRSTAIEYLWIDTSKGVDAAAPEQESQPAKAAQAPAPAIASLSQPTPLPQELARAAQICARAGRVLQSMFSDVRLGRPIELDNANRMVQQMHASIQRNPHALISLARIKSADNYTYLHSMAVCTLMMALAQRMQMNENEVRQAGLAGLLHDVGKCRIPLRILNKPGALTQEEWRIMQDHSMLGAQLLRPLDVPEPVLNACLQHHERMDGTGYPGRLKGEQIHQLSRMTAICDIYDAVTSDRPYKKGWPPAQALHRMAQWCGDHLDKAIFEQFVQTVGIYPVGSLVRLSTEQLAVVIDVTSQNLLCPLVRVFYCIPSGQHLAPAEMDLQQSEVRITSREDPQDWPLGDINALWQPCAERT
ncbi:MAG: HD-GYP domain-containing protein [Comamonas sp.]|jgi:putative nucleotidyltransferase with HDIG domain|uniref:HD-GYP domain-containing protein n=1 Tax=Comamonas sp. TaxID=34028 RepID=UPI00281AA8F1|nr:HD-GYP domain-containing protein [Comamonas sp.]MDR0216266.1 HD-GYP domain-containing protein [Comamonas sp.]